MTSIHEETNVQSDAISARGHLQAFFEEQHDEVFLRTRGRRNSNFDALFDLEWEVDGDGPFPHFSGTLSIEQTASSTCIIALDGGYIAPYGTAGRIFDTMFGHAIARSTVRNLLRSIRTFIEENCTQPTKLHMHVRLAT